MAKRAVIWTETARKEFRKTLAFYRKRNGSSQYSKKLSGEIKDTLRILSGQPYAGKLTDVLEVRIAIKQVYEIYYKLEDHRLVVLLVWDTRRDPNNLKEYITL